MNKSSLRNLLGTVAIIVCNVVLLLTQQSKFAAAGDEISSFVGLLALSAIFSGMVGGIIAPYTYKRVVLYVEGMLAGVILLGGIILLLVGQEFGNTTNGLAELGLIIIIIILLVGMVLGVIASGLGFFIGAFIGSKIGKKFTQNYTLETDEQADFNSTPFPSRM